MRQVCGKEWNNLPFDAEHLDLSNVKNLSDRESQKTHSLELKKDAVKSHLLKLYWLFIKITDAGLAYLAKLPALHLLTYYGV